MFEKGDKHLHCHGFLIICYFHNRWRIKYCLRNTYFLTQILTVLRLLRHGYNEMNYLLILNGMHTPPPPPSSSLPFPYRFFCCTHIPSNNFWSWAILLETIWIQVLEQVSDFWFNILYIFFLRWHRLRHFPLKFFFETLFSVNVSNMCHNYIYS